MIWQLMRRDPAMRWTLIVTPAFAAIFALWHFLAAADGDSAFLVLPLACLTLAALVAAYAQSDDTGFQSILPVTVRQVFLSRMLSMFAMLWLPVIAGMAVLAALRDQAVNDLPLLLWSAFTCVVLGIQCAGVRNLSTPATLAVVLAPAGALISGVVVRNWFGEGPAETVAVAASWTIGASIVLATWRTVLPSFQDAPLEAAAAKARPEPLARKRPGSAPSWRTEFRIICRMLGFGALVPFAVMLLNTSNPFWYIYAGFQWSGLRSTFRWMFPLPVRPRILLAAAVLPTLLGLTAGYLVNVNFPWLPAFRSPGGISLRQSQSLAPVLHGVILSPDCGTFNILPPEDYWIPVRSGKAPAIQAPWGETFQPPTSRMMGYDIYNPFAVGCGNSRRFLDWQFNRATVAVYGRPIALDQDMHWDTKQPAITALRTQLVHIGCVAAFSMLSFLIALALDWHRFRRLSRTMRIAVMSLIGAAGAGLLALAVLNDWDVMQWVSWTLPQNLPVAILLLVLTLELLYLATAKLFSQLEFVDKPPTRRV